MKRTFVILYMVLFTILVNTTVSYAADYAFITAQDASFYSSTSYNEVYETEYYYAGQNQIDFDIPKLQYGLSQQFLEQSLNNPYFSSTTQYGLSGSSPSDSGQYPEVEFSGSTAGSGSTVEITYQPDLTAKDLLRSDGSMGTVTISRVGLFAKVYEGASIESMAKGAGHYTGTGLWTGNVCLFGHNRGSHPYFSTLKNVKVGDTITYQTSLGTRTYTAIYVGTISSTDYSRLNEMGDNRITLFTCVANQPSLRLCVQAVESK